MKGTVQDTASLAKLVSNEDEASRLGDFIVDETASDTLGAVIREMEVARLRETIVRLPQKARYFLVRRQGLDDRDTLTLAELAAELGISRQRVGHVQREAEYLPKSGTRRASLRSVA